MRSHRPLVLIVPLVLLVFLSACGPTDESVFPDAFTRADAGAQDDARAPVFDAPRIDARPLPDAPVLPQPDAPAVSPEPDAGMPANVGWIGGTCGGAADCHLTNAICLGADFPDGLCTAECTGVCPDRHEPRDTVTACVDGRPFGFDQGLCVSRCDQTVWPGSGCAPGMTCLPKSRYGTPTTILSVCVPDVTPAGCPDGRDELVPLAYPQHGSVWIPAEAQCGGSFPLVVMLHGINPGKNPTPSLGGGRRLEYEVRSLIDAHVMDPVVLAEPVQDDDDSAASTTLYDSAEFNPAHHLDLVGDILGPRGITLVSLSYTGHSGAGCDPDNGLYLILDRYDDLIPTYAASMRLWGLEDICYSGAYHYQAPLAVLGDQGTVIFNMFTVQGDPGELEDGLLPDPQPVADCPASLYTQCIRDPVKPYCSYRTTGILHDENPWFFVREAFPQVFSNRVPCR